MKFPPALNPLRRTQFAWLIPFTWTIVKCAAIATPTTIEVFLHHRFGARSGRSLFKGFLLLLVMGVVLSADVAPATIPLFQGYVFAYALAAIGQWLTSRFRPIEQIHSLSSGDPWPLWQKIPVGVATVRQFLEPVLCGLIACILAPFDGTLGRWLILAAIALFVKEQVRRSQLRSRRLDALDNRAETERAFPRVRGENEPFVEARPAPPRPPRP